MEITQYEIACAECGVTFWLTDDHDSQLRATHQRFYCPNGHKNWYEPRDIKKKKKKK